MTNAPAHLTFKVTANADQWICRCYKEGSKLGEMRYGKGDVATREEARAKFVAWCGY